MSLPVPIKDNYLLQCNTVQFGTELPTSHRATQHASTIHPEDGERRYLRNVRTHLPKLMATTFPSTAVQNSFLLHASFPTNVLYVFLVSCLVSDGECPSAVTITRTEDNQLA